MSKAVYIATSEQNSGKSIITLGLMSMLMGKTAKVGYFRPIIEDFVDGDRDNHIDTVLTHFNLDIAFEDNRNPGSVPGFLCVRFRKFRCVLQ